MTTPWMVFHHPLPLRVDPVGGSQVRPVRMVEAFGSIGFDVVTVTGHSGPRREAMEAVRRRLRAGDRPVLCYGESSTAPTTLTDPRHLPTHPLLDLAFFRALRSAGVPAGIFYRDVHWRFPVYRELVPLAKRLPALAAYRYDLAWYQRYLDAVFVPTLRLREAVPGRLARVAVHPLPPGARIVEHPRRPADDRLRLLYVGTVRPPLYDVSPLLRAVDAVAGVELTVCCPPADAGWLRPRAGASVTVVHAHGRALDDLYAAADAACLVYTPYEYRDLALPIKLFEALGHGVPVIANGSSATTDLVAADGVGWRADDDGLAALLTRLRGDRSEVERAAAVTRCVRAAHTWQARAEQVVATLVERR